VTPFRNPLIVLPMETTAIETSKLLRDVVVFSLLSDEELQEIAGRFERITCQLGELVVRAGDPGEAFFVIASGRARVVAGETTLAILTTGQAFGEQALLTGSRQSCSVRAMGELELLRLGGDEFLQVVNNHPQMRAYLQHASTETSARQFLKLCPAFTSLSPSEISELLSCLQERNFAPRER
jgi:CRP-like cAMP-binding protein